MIDSHEPAFTGGHLSAGKKAQKAQKANKASPGV